MTGIKCIAIIGAGPTGIAFARYLKAESVFDRIDIFEQRDNVGGIWNLSNPVASKQIPIPQTNPSYGAGEVMNCNDDQRHVNKVASLELESPLYDYLETNIPKTMMAFSGHPFKTDLPLYPGHADVLEYLQDDAASVRHLIHFQTQVMGLQLHSSKHTASNNSCLAQQWQITTRNLSNGQPSSAVYDAVVMANGHYTVPHVPEISGLALWNQKYPNTVIHSKAYRKPEDYNGKRVVVVGNSASGLDIAAQMAPHIQRPLYLASRSSSQLAPSGSGPEWREDIAEIEEFLVDGDHHRAIQSRDGKIVSDIDVVIFATGYFYSFPFITSFEGLSGLGTPEESPSRSSRTSVSPEQSDAEHEDESSVSPSAARSLQHITTTGLRTHDVYKHFIHIEYPNLALPVLNLKIVPFPLAENQAAIIARMWSGRLRTPSKVEMRQWERAEQFRLIQAKRLRSVPNIMSDSGNRNHSDDTAFNPRYEGGFHTLVYPEDANQMNSLYNWAVSAQRREGLENGGIGKLGTRWNERQVWLRGKFPDIKAAYAKFGEERISVTSLEGLGEGWAYGFEKWKLFTSAEDQEELFKAAATPGWI